MARFDGPKVGHFGPKKRPLIDEFHIIDAILNWGARFENRGSDILLKLQRNIASNDLNLFLLAREGFWLGLCHEKISKEL